MKSGTGAGLGIGAAIAAVVALGAKQRRDQARRDALLELLNGSALPARLAQWAPQLATATIDSAPGDVPDDRWALFLAGVLGRESEGGSALQPRGPAGTGDPTPRWRAGPPAWAVTLDLVTGETRDRDGVTQYRIRPPTAGGATVPGWGYGLGQHDWEDSEGRGTRAWIESGAWIDPGANILRSSRHLAGLFGEVKLVEGIFDLDDRLLRTAAAYNAGTRALRAADPDSYTTPGPRLLNGPSRGDYGRDVLARADSFQEARTA